MDQYSYQHIKQVYEEKEYSFFTGAPFDLNILGVRLVVDENKFDDIIGMAYIDGAGKECVKMWAATTDPGWYWLENPLNKKGTAILVPGQYKGVYKIDYHNGQYEALCQRKGKVRVFRDNDRDKEHDMKYNTIAKGDFGINIHRSNPYTESYQINKWSAGCQVFKRIRDFEQFMTLVSMEEKYHGNDTHTYTLLEKADFDV